MSINKHFSLIVIIRIDYIFDIACCNLCYSIRVFVPLLLKKLCHDDASPNNVNNFSTCGPNGMFYIAQYAVHWTAQSAVHFLPSFADLIIPTQTWLLLEAF